MKFRFSGKFVVDSDVEPWRREGLRISMLGGPGSGKSWNNSLIAEQFLSQSGTVVIFQPRDEYFTLKEKFDILSVGGVHAKDMDFALTSPSMYAKAVVEDGMSVIFYTSAAEDEEKLIDWVSRFISYILNYQERHKRPLLLILEEAQEYAPRSASGHIAPPWVYNRMIKAFKDCFTQGRKLNIIAIASSQRPQELNFTVRQLSNLTFYGKFSDQDIGYVDKECLKYVRKQGIEVDASRLVSLGMGEWLVIMGKQTRFVKVTQPRLTKHGAETPRLEYVAPRTKRAKKTIDQLAKTIMEALHREEAEKSELEKAKRKIRDLEKRLEAAEEKARIKLSVKEMLKAGPESTDLAEKLAEAEEELKKLEQNLKTVEGTLAKKDDRIRELTLMEAERSDQLENARQELKVLEELRQVFSKIFPGERIPGFESRQGRIPPEAPLDEGRITMLVDERLTQRLPEAGEIQLVNIDVGERIRELVKEDFVSAAIQGIESLPEPAKKAARYIREKRKVGVGDLYFFLYQKTGRPPGSFYNNVTKPLEAASLVRKTSGEIEWIMEDSLLGRFKDFVKPEDLESMRRYLLSLLL